ncbi:helix-turn-helix domain-containing protein [Paenibacillus melissococcoides]|uniref:Helix-turn-helix domain-containing protein n=1 Tax=Paenibacillus melissococcoides TaxID=2912268 RepID=A0ABM9GEF4_9BACL|nr:MULTISPECIES: helix-turn-helix domain-containing protein [Paenibacillus]MEB9896551.1 helix-turn-helix domain-containing protein [Bacillus cereus]CAH8249691.1 helix-turn-helix domain-containing protein [Paenibacillus melissococcoides]CAH8721543.1 helix-turn-helix domain-containing protein [Paenibacillus melissococcoides]CAH8721676.1 helix-turn-helix domain-containing protein [Paenibacillus melissococcoides]GIO81235.1 transcriptional regulator [Paenibacillus dendritiformis]
MKTIGERLRFLREQAGLSMNELEDSIGASRGSVNKWEKGSIPGGKYLITLSDYFNVSTDWILKGEKEIFAQNEVSKRLNSELPELSYSDIELLAKFHQLTEKEQGRIEERIEIYLSERKTKTDSSSKQSRSTNGDGREEAASRTA